MHARRRFLFAVMGTAVAGCARQPQVGRKFLTYDGPEVTQLFISKQRRSLYLLSGEEVLRRYDIELGFEPIGHKRERGDGRTPEGFYLIDRRNPNSAYHLSLGISYPNRADWEAARAAGIDPGGDIFIHGENTKGPNGEDWTAGCIAVQDHEMEEIYAMVRDGTPIYIAP